MAVRKDPDIIISRFNKHIAVRGKYLTDRGRFLFGEEILLEIPVGSRFCTTVTTGHIVGSGEVDALKEEHSTGQLKYHIVDENGRKIKEKTLLGDARGVEINGKSVFWLPREAVLPFCNLLNFLR